MEGAVAILIGAGFIACSLGLAWNVWGLRCNARTHDQRSRLIDWVYSDPTDWRRRGARLHAVEYEDHMRALMWLRDPWQLYGAEIKYAMSAPAPEQGGEWPPAKDTD